MLLKNKINELSWTMNSKNILYILVYSLFGILIGTLISLFIKPFDATIVLGTMVIAGYYSIYYLMNHPF